jgi:hypothetical protein
MLSTWGVQLTKTFPAEAFREALESWSWLPLADKVPVLATAFGDVILQEAEGYWFLDAAGGKLDKIASNRDELKAALSSPEGQDQYLLAGLAQAAETQGLRLADSEVFDFAKPPVLGGQFVVENLQPKDFVVSLNISGQIHNQVRNLPPGKKISNIKIS